jgi:hypothetical protein
MVGRRSAKVGRGSAKVRKGVFPLQERDSLVARIHFMQMPFELFSILIMDWIQSSKEDVDTMCKEGHILRESGHLVEVAGGMEVVGDTARAWLSLDNALGHVFRTPTMNRPSADTYTAEPIIGFCRLSRTMSSVHRTVYVYLLVMCKPGLKPGAQPGQAYLGRAQPGPSDGSLKA